MQVLLIICKEAESWCMTIKFLNSLIHLKMIQRLLIVVLSGLAISVVKLEWLVTYH